MHCVQVRHLGVLSVLMVLGLLWQADPGASANVGQCRVATDTYGIMYALVASQLIMTHMVRVRQTHLFSSMLPSMPALL